MNGVLSGVESPRHPCTLVVGRIVPGIRDPVGNGRHSEPQPAGDSARPRSRHRLPRPIDAGSPASDLETRSLCGEPGRFDTDPNGPVEQSSFLSVFVSLLFNPSNANRFSANAVADYSLTPKAVERICGNGSN